jgi:digeranylgeranylglycerophospholipid reductase
VYELRKVRFRMSVRSAGIYKARAGQAMKPKYDVVVVGAGPAGTTAARYASMKGLSVLILEKDMHVGRPVRCGEAVSSHSIKSLVEFDPRWIAATITRFRLVAPNGTCVEPDTGGTGYVLDRSLFDYDLALQAVHEGAELVTDAYVNRLLEGEKGWNGVTFIYKGREHRVLANIIIGADGVESRIGKWARINTTTRLSDMESCAQMVLDNVVVEDDVCELYFGDSVAPKGYLWVFPKGRGRANVGVGISSEANRHRSALQYLNDFVRNRFPRAKICSTVAGGVPCAASLPNLVNGNVLLVGDAAHQVNPMSGGGITSGMRAGKLGGEAVALALDKGNLKLLQSYENEWEKLLGSKHRMYHKMKNTVYMFSDDLLNDVAARVLSLPPEKRTIWGVFKIALLKHPALVWEMVKTFGLGE